MGCAHGGIQLEQEKGNPALGGDLETRTPAAGPGQRSRRPRRSCQTGTRQEEDAPPPNIITFRPSQYVLQKIPVYKYVELWYFTKDGCFEATQQAHLQADDAFGLLFTNEVLTLYLVALVKASKYAKADHELMLTEILQAWTSYLKHIKEASWPKKHISVLFKFFWNIECHPFCISTWHGDHILTTYTAKTRRHWYNRLKTGNAFNIAYWELYNTLSLTHSISALLLQPGLDVLCNMTTLSTFLSPYLWHHR